MAEEELRLLAHDLSEAPRKMQREAVAIVEHVAVRVKKGWARNAEASSGHHAPRYPASINYDLSLGAALVGRVEAVIGPDKTKPQGPLGNLLEFGSAKNPPHNDGGRALRAEAYAFELEISQAAFSVLD